MDHNTPMFIANNGMGGPRTTPNQRLFKPLALGPCYGCGGNHWYRDCLDRKDKPMVILPIKRFLHRLWNQALDTRLPSNREPKDNVTLNYWPSSYR